MVKRPYQEGSLFAVPLRDHGYARGVVARRAKRGGVLLGYFFGPRLPAIEDTPLDDLEPRHALLISRFGDLGLLNGEWLVVGPVANWNRLQWPMPQFVRRDPLQPKAWTVRYADDDPSKVVGEYPIGLDAAFPSDSLAGYGSIEIKLTRLLACSGQQAMDRRNQLSE